MRAQDDYDALPQPKPTFSKVVFNAYHEILESYGITPEKEDPRASLLFLVVGESGPLSLPERYEVVLSRKRIALDFGETTVDTSLPSQQTTTSISTGSSEARARSPKEHYTTATKETREPPQWQQRARQRQEARELQRKLDRAHFEASGREIELVRKQSDELMRKVDEAKRRADATSAASSTASVKDAEASAELRERLRKRHQEFREERNASVLRQERNAERRQQRADEQRRATSRRGSGASSHMDQDEDIWMTQADLSDRPQTPEEVSKSLFEKAGRAREIFLASKYFNIWAERTASRIEREAVARRHMIRFRCFQGWSKTPASLLPAAQHLTTLTAVEKLKRAAVTQESQLRSASVAVSQDKLVDRAKVCLNQWHCHLKERTTLANAVSEDVKDTVTTWMGRTKRQSAQATDTAKLVLRHRVQRDFTKWIYKANQHSRWLRACREASDAEKVLATADTWYNFNQEMETANSFRAITQDEKRQKAANLWRLQTRESAFRGKIEYAHALNSVQQWQKYSGSNAERGISAASYSKTNSTAAPLHQWRRCSKIAPKLSRFAARSHMYIAAHKLLDTLENENKKIVQKKKDAIRLVMRIQYKAASARRKRRLFDSSLNKWLSLAMDLDQQTSKADEEVVQQRQQRKTVTFDAWAIRGYVNQLRRETARQSEANRSIDKWANIATEASNVGSEARHYHYQSLTRDNLRVWSRSNLQSSGQSHTATKVREQHDNELRRRRFYHWRLWRSDKARPSYVPGSAPPANFRSSRTGRFKNLAQNPLGRSVHGAVDTPTRWTGNARPLATLSEAAPPFSGRRTLYDRRLL